MNTVFVSIPYNGRFDDVYDLVYRLASQRQLQAVRVDRLEKTMEPVATLIQRCIREARLVVADITGNNPNVLHEVGLAQALGKPLVLLTQDPPESAAFNVRGFALIKYDPHQWEQLEQKLSSALAEATSPNELLRAMLAPSTLGWPQVDTRFVVIASPLSYRRAQGRSGGYTKLRRTSSDYVGVRGILQGFGLLFDFDVLPDMLDPEDCHDSVLEEEMNLYCIASPKANRWTEIILEKYSRHWAPTLAFRPDPKSKDVRNVSLSILSDGQVLGPPGWSFNDEGDRYQKDFGLIVRGPNPYHPDLMVAILAGRSSLGTEAACLAFTDPEKVKMIQDRIAPVGGTVENHKVPFWVLVSMQRAIGDHKEESIVETLTIERADVFARK